MFGTVCLALCTGSAVAHADLSAEGARVRMNAQDEQAVPAQPQGWLSGWSGSFELGLNGASGNNENFNFRAGANAQREDERTADRFNLAYTYASDDGDQTQSRLTADARHDWKAPDSKLRVYLGAAYEYDEFQDWDHRFSVGPGVGYQAVDNEKTNLLLRAGVLGTREFGGSDDRWHPEADLGLDLTHKLTERQNLDASFDLYPSLDPAGPYRLVGKAGWQIDLDPEANLYLRLGLEDRYDSSPGPDKRRNDVAYYATVGWSF